MVVLQKFLLLVSSVFMIYLQKNLLKASEDVRLDPVTTVILCCQIHEMLQQWDG